MPVRVEYDPDCDPNVQPDYGAQIQAWMNANRVHAVDIGQITIDRAIVL